MEKKILVIEDDKNINDLLRKVLETNHFSVVSAFSGTEGVLLHNDEICLILLDLMLPGKNGEEIIKELKEKKDVPVLVMSAIHDLDKKLDLFQLGADDYITKPFHQEELLARIKVHLRNQKGISSQKILTYQDICMNLGEYSVICNKKEVNLTKNEFELLKVLIENQNQVVTKSFLFDRVWSTEESADDNTLNVHISKLRNKLREVSPNKEYIETVWSIGYKMK